MNPGNEANGWERPPEYDDPPEPPACPVCGAAMEWERCWTGCDDGFVDEYAEDPINNDPGDERPCHECGGAGGYPVCPNAGRHDKAQEPGA